MLQGLKNSSLLLLVWSLVFAPVLAYSIDPHDACAPAVVEDACCCCGGDNALAANTLSACACDPLEAPVKPQVTLPLLPPDVLPNTLPAPHLTLLGIIPPLHQPPTLFAAIIPDGTLAVIQKTRLLL